MANHSAEQQKTCAVLVDKKKKGIDVDNRNTPWLLFLVSCLVVTVTNNLSPLTTGLSSSMANINKTSSSATNDYKL